jgi:hypothetical protein
MKVLDIIIGFIIGFITAFIGGFIYLFLFTKFNLFTNFEQIVFYGILPPVLKLGAILNIAVFFILLKFNKDDMAKGIIVSFVVISILAFFI